MNQVPFSLAAAVLLGALPAVCSGDQVLVRVEPVPADGLVVAEVDLGPAARQAGIDGAEALQGLAEVAGQPGSPPKPVPLQFIPGPVEQERFTGVLLLRLPEGSSGVVRLAPSETNGPAETAEWDGAVSTKSYTLRHDPKKMGGMPSTIRFAGTDRTFESFRWADRLFNPDVGGFTLAGDAEASAELVSRGPLATVVRTRARYVQGEKVPPSKPHAVYDWLYFHDRPLVFVRGRMEQAAPHAWKEVHFLELDYPREALPRWAGGEPCKQGEFTGSRDSFGFPDFGAVHDGRNAVAMMRCGQALLYDGGPGTYLQARGDEAWQGFAGTRRETSAWLWIGSAEDLVAAIREAAGNLPTAAQVTVTVDRVRARIAAARRELGGLTPEERRKAWWRVSGAEALEAAGRFDEGRAVASGEVPETWAILDAGELGLILERTEDGMRPVDLFDAAEGRHLLAAVDLPLFTAVLRHVETKEEVKLEADHGWTDCTISHVEAQVEGGEVELRWKSPAEQRLAGLRVTARAIPDASANAIRWKLAVDGVPPGWTLWEVTFPQVPVAELGPGAKVLFPRGCGEVQEDVWERSFRFGGTYPSGWTSMQFMAAYDHEGRTGLYVAAHDPMGSTKDVLVESRDDRGVAAPAAEAGGAAVRQRGRRAGSGNAPVRRRGLRPARGRAARDEGYRRGPWRDVPRRAALRARAGLPAAGGVGMGADRSEEWRGLTCPKPPRPGPGTLALRPSPWQNDARHARVGRVARAVSVFDIAGGRSCPRQKNRRKRSGSRGGAF